jgi:hypothetical protein
MPVFTRNRPIFGSYVDSELSWYDGHRKSPHQSDITIIDPELMSILHSYVSPSVIDLSNVTALPHRLPHSGVPARDAHPHPSCISRTTSSIYFGSATSSPTGSAPALLAASTTFITSVYGKLREAFTKTVLPG